MILSMKKYLLLGLISFVFFACNENSRNFRSADFYSGTIQVLSKKDGTLKDETTIDIRVKLDNNSFYRVDENGKRTCFGNLNHKNDTFEFSSDECACHCDCNPNIDCAGDLILGTYDVVFESDDRLELNIYQDLSNLTYPYPYDEWEKIIILEKE